MKKQISLALFIFIVFLLQSVLAGGLSRPKKTKCVSPTSLDHFLTARPVKELKTVAANKAETTGNIVVVEANEQLLILPNPFDLAAKAVRFQPVGPRFAYDLGISSFNASISRNIAMSDDASVEYVFRNFHFPFGGQTYDRCYLNSNGNITFGQPDPDPPNIDTLIHGPARIAPFFTDLDPEGAGTVFVYETTDSVTFSWLKVPEFFNQNQFGYGENTFQVVLYSDGRIDLVYSDEITATQAFVGVIQGSGKLPIRSVNFSERTSKNRPFKSIVEDFRNYESVDIPELLQSFYRRYPDRYDFITLLSNFELNPVPGAQAFAINVQNTTRGIGNPSSNGNAIFRENKKYGSSEKLQNITFLGNLRQYPPDPNQTLPDSDTSLLDILAHEVGHRWLSYVKISKDGEPSSELLGRDNSHWSFFFDSDGSFLEGNQIVQNGSRFETRAPFQRYSKLDLYLMGLLSDSEVGELFLVTGANDFSTGFTYLPESAPEANISFSGNTIPITIDDIIFANGTRSPDTRNSQKTFRHLFVLITKSETPASPEDIGFVENLRLQWKAFFSEATSGLGTINTDVE